MATQNGNTWTLAPDEVALQLTGAGDADIVGNALANEIVGNAGGNAINGGDGNDTLDGGGGLDTLRGGIGDDVYLVNAVGLVIEESDGEGTDRIEATVGIDLSALAHVENVELLGSADLDAIGNASGNTLQGSGGANQLDGAGGDDMLLGLDGDDSQVGGEGDDTLDGGNGDDTLEGGAGADTLLGGADDDSLNGGVDSDALEGESGDDTLDGGAGADFLAGGEGDDVYFVDDEGDVVEEVEGDSGGVDEIRTSLGTFSLAGFAHVENLTLLEGALDGTGNDLDNRIVGNDDSNELAGGEGNDELHGHGEDDELLGQHGDDLLFGGEGSDDLLGGEDNDTLDGGAGADWMDGGAGDDTYVVDNDGDIIVEEANSGNDTIVINRSFSLSDPLYANFENIVLTVAGTATGNDQSNELTGSSGNDVLNGEDGNDSLYGEGGDDSLNGGRGSDRYFVDSVADVVTEVADDLESDDEVWASVTWTLGDHVEHLQLTGTAAIDGSGNSLDNWIFGNEKDNRLSGHGGDDALVGGVGNDVLTGGSGEDTLIGGTGDDTYRIDSTDADLDGRELAGEGRDTVEADFSYTLRDHFENLTLLAGAVTGTGNALDNVLIGNAGANTLIGGDGNDRLDGGAGADRMEGGNGDDVYIVKDAGDVVIETGTGTDTVNSDFSYTLGANVEKLILHGDLIAMSGTGNALDNQLFGNRGATTLDGGAGNDLLEGGEGNDLLLGGDGNDTLQDYLGDDVMVGGAGDDYFTGGKGNDTLDGGVGKDTAIYLGNKADYIIAANADGSLTITDTLGRDGTDIVRGMQALSFKDGLMELGVDGLPPLPLPPPLILKGNKKNNTLTAADTDDLLFGLAGNDTLKGLGGSDRLYGGVGKDKLYGGAGADVFVFNTKPHKTKDLDKIYDYKVVDDSIWLDNKIFKKLGKKGTETAPAPLNKKFFTLGDKAKDKNDYLVYNKNTGALFYDADGSGAGAAVQIATLSKKLKMTDKDFFVV